MPKIPDYPPPDNALDDNALLLGWMGAKNRRVGMRALAGYLVVDAEGDSEIAAMSQRAAKTALDLLRGGDGFTAPVVGRTPNAGSTGGFRVVANQISGLCIFQFLTHDEQNEVGHLSANVGDGVLRWQGYKLYHDGNMGPGSGMNSDKLDGQEGAYYSDVKARLGYTPIDKAGDRFTGPVTFQTPNAGSTGGQILAGNADSGLAFSQVVSPDRSSQWGAWKFDATGGVWWNDDAVWRAGLRASTVVPLGNPYATTKSRFAAATLNGDDAAIAGVRGFNVIAGVDNKGQDGLANVDDLVAGYFANIASPVASGSQDTPRRDTWAINTVTVISANSGTGNHRGIEVDFVNNLRAIGSEDGPGYTAEVGAFGVQAYMSGPFGATSAFIADHGSDGSVGWIRGFTVAAGAASQAGFADYSNSAYAFDVRGAHAYGLHIIGTCNFNVVNGPMRIGDTANPEAGVTLDVAGLLKARNGANVIGGSLNVGAGLGMLDGGSYKLVSFGASDSGGSGYKVMRIPN